MATEKLRAELELITRKAERDLAKFDRKLSKVDAKVRDLGGKGGAALRPLGTGLSNATANASEFEKSMAAANARVIAFGASAGLVLQVSRAIKETVKATIQVEKALTDVNVVLNTSMANLQKFGSELFKIAGQTGQSFQTIAVGATELARQGLGTEKTLKRLNDAMILSRLTGMGAEEAVSSLTAAVNSFSKAGITSAQVINKMAKVDQAFAVSSDDLAKAISRVGSSAVDAGVSLDELMAITTAVQQRTARGGAVIGNAFKTIFTRIGRTDIQKKLAEIGVATRDMATGAMLPATVILQNLAGKFQNLQKAQQNQLAESVAGVFQVNILRAALGDLSNQYGVYNRALKISGTATDEAYKKNEKLNETLDALVNKTLANLTKMGAGIGGAAFEPAIRRVLDLVNSAIGAFGEGGRFEEFGKGLGKDILKGLGSFISGPGLVLLTVGISKLVVNFASFAKTAVAGVLELNKGVLARKGLEEQVTATLMRQPSIIKQIQSGEISAATAAKDMLATMRAQNMQADKLAITTRMIASQMMGIGGFMGGRGGGRPGRASGFVPNFANADGERAAAAMGGYRAGGIKSMSIPGQGSVMYNGAETVKKFPGFTQPAIMPPKKSFAGANYKSAFGAAHGFDPYAGSGFVPNFWGLAAGATRSSAISARMGQPGYISQLGQTKGMTLEQAIESGINRGALSSGFGKAAVDKRAGMVSLGGKPVTKGDAVKNTLDVQGQLGVVSAYGFGSGVREMKSATTTVGQLGVFKELQGTKEGRKIAEEKIRFDNIQVSSLLGMEKNVKKSLRSGKDTSKKPSFSKMINQELINPLARIGQKLVTDGVLKEQGPRVADIKGEMLKGGKRLLPKQSEGELFETAIRLALHSKRRFMSSITGSNTAPFDFEEAASPTTDFKKKLGFDLRLRKADAKRTGDQPAINSIIKKAYNLFVLNKGGLLRGKGDRLMPLIAGPKGTSTIIPLTGRINQGQAFKRLYGTATPSQASGFIPNYSPLGDALGRERAAGVPRSAIRIGSSLALASSANPGGLGVYNTIDEPRGLEQGISRSKGMGINPKSHGASQGFIPNFPTPSSGDRTPWGSKPWFPGDPVPSASAPAPAPKPAPKPSFHDSYIEWKKKNYKMVDGKEIRIKEPAEKIKKGADKFSKSVDKFSSKLGGMSMGLMGAAFMAGPAIERQFGPGAQEKMTGAFTGMMIGQAAYGLAGGMTGAVGNWMKPRKKGLARSKFNLLGSKIGRSGFVKGLSKVPKIGKVVQIAAAGTAAAGTYFGMQSKGSDLEYQATMERLAKERGELNVASGAVEVLGGTSGKVAENRDVMTNAQIVEAYKQVDKQYEDVLKTAPEGFDTDEITSAYENYMEAMLDDSKNIETAEQRASKSLENLTKKINELNDAAAGKESVAEAKKYFADNEETMESFGRFGGEAVGFLGQSRGAGERNMTYEEKEALFLKMFGREGANLLENDGEKIGNWIVNAPGGYSKESYASGQLSKMDVMADAVGSMGGAIGLLNPASWGSEALQASSDWFGTGSNDELIALQQRFGRWGDMENYSPKFRETMAAYNRKVYGGVGIGTDAGLSDKEQEAVSFIKKNLFTENVQKGLEKAWFGDLDFSKLDEGDRKGREAIIAAKIEELKTKYTPGRFGGSQTPIKDLLKTKDKEGEDVFSDKAFGTYVGNQSNMMAAKGAAVQQHLRSLSPALILKMLMPERPPEVKRAMEDLKPLALKQIQSEQLAKEQSRTLELLKARNANAEKLVKVEEDLALAQAKATKDAEGVAKVDFANAMARTKRKFERLGTELDESFKGKATEAKGKMQQILLQAKFKTPQESARATKIHTELQGILGMKDPRTGKDLPYETKLSVLQNRLASATVRAGQTFHDTKEAAFAATEKKLTEQTLALLELGKEKAHLMAQYNANQISENELNTELDKLRRKQLELEFEYNRDAAVRNRNIKASQATGQARWSAVDLATGKISGGTWASIQKSTRQAQRDAHGLDPAMGGVPTASIGTIFGEEWKYNSRSQTEEFEDGMADVARTIKSSLKTAIKDIVSGAESFEDGMYRVFAALADKLADQGISMGVNSLFGMFGGSKGGMVPRGYNKGGMVRGGSGVRDDVLTYMQGGEYVIRKSAVNQIPGGEATLNAINGGNARGGLIPSYPTGGLANVSLAKEFLFNDPKRPTSGGYNISGALSTSALFREDDPQTENTIGKQAKFVQYQDYRRREQERRDKIIEDIERQKKGRLYNAYLSAALRVGAGALGKTGSISTGGGAARPREWVEGGTTEYEHEWGTGGARGGFIPGFARGGPARVMGGEFIMSSGTTAEHGTAFMSQLNRGRLPGFQEGGLVGGGSAAMMAGLTTNNVNLSINIDKSGGAEVTAEKSGRDRSKNDERSTSEEAEDSKKLAEGIRNAVIKEIITQQRPGGLLRDGASASRLRQP